MASENGKKPNWFKNVLSGQNQPDLEAHIEAIDKRSVSEENIDPANEAVETVETPTQPQSFNLLSKDKQDKVSLDLIVSLENMLKDRQLILYKVNELQDQVGAANETIQRYIEDKRKTDLLILKKNEELEDVEDKLTRKQMSYDQLLEDYKSYQSAARTDFDQLSSQLEQTKAKYDKLNEETTNSQYESMIKIKQLEENIRSLEVENQNYREQYERINQEKAELMKTINDFTERMSISFSPFAKASDTTDE
ncbi:MULTISPECIES: hypothetical protein [unclassified Virgibacillus]|uniref:hypothetical protein n=1 Tax=unclassified Virgibacillus TaxID=2620237 RepID=UPI0024DE061E|nr:hypothetical protein [Virgibacillus sp. LDC-1]